MEIDFAADAISCPDDWKSKPEALLQWQRLIVESSESEEFDSDEDPRLIELKQRRREWEKSLNDSRNQDAITEIIRGIDRAIADGRYDDCLAALNPPKRGLYPFIEENDTKQSGSKEHAKSRS
ncbi:MAG: hypothetical protein PHV74_12950 [Dehalococcoidia bacterium]|nr:hypothetical protein [Dehalococcoidia bacterium]